MKKSLLSFAAAITMTFLLSVPVYAEAAGEITHKSDSTDYSDHDNWAFWNYGEDKDTDLFIVCPVVDMGKGGNYNADITNEKIRSNFVGALNMELGIYTDTASVYSPYYRQATFPVYSLDRAEREQYMQIAYEDVRNAFLYYSDNCDESRPLILAGFSQGSDMILRLMTEFFGDEKYSDRLVAAYAMGWSLTEEQTARYPWLKPAQGEDDTGVIVMFNTEAEHISSSLIVGENEHTYAINPLNWKTDGTPADKSLNKGACFTDYGGNIKSEEPELTGAYIDSKRGTLKVTDINEADYPAALFDEGIYHIYDYQFFFRNLQENVAERTAAYLNEKTAEENAEDVFYSLALNVMTDVDECYVGDAFIVTVSIDNNGDGDLTNMTVYFEDEAIYSAEKYVAGEVIAFKMKLWSLESDIESGGVINISVAADELSEPVRAVCSVKVKAVETEPEESNPATGTDDSVPMMLCLGSLAAVVIAGKAKRK